MCLYFIPLGICCHYLPYIWLLSIPLCGILWGPEQTARQSIAMFVFITLSNVIPKDLKQWVPCVDVIIFVGLMLFPYTVLPDLVIWAYAHGMWILEPLFLCVESYQSVIIIRTSGQWLSDLVHERDVFGKVTALLVTGFVYLLSVLLLINVFSAITISKIWSFLICAAYIGILIGVTIYFEYGIISDSAFVTAFISLVMFAAVNEASGPVHVLQPSQHIGKSYLDQLLELPILTTAAGNNSLLLVRELFSPTVWILLAVRLSSVMSLLIRYLPQESPSSTDDDDKYHPRLRLLFINVAVVFLYCQTVIKRLSAPAAYITAGRYLQAIITGVFYVASLLYQEDVWE